MVNILDGLVEKETEIHVATTTEYKNGDCHRYSFRIDATRARARSVELMIHDMLDIRHDGMGYRICGSVRSSESMLYDSSISPQVVIGTDLLKGDVIEYHICPSTLHVRWTSVGNEERKLLLGITINGVIQCHIRHNFDRISAA